MITIFIWRLLFESLSLLKALGYRGREVFYFAYGANLDPEVMNRRGMTGREARPVVISGFVLRFSLEIPCEGVGMGSIEKSPNDSVPGTCYKMYKIDEWLMDCFECCAIFRRYRKGFLEIEGKLHYYYYAAAPKAGLLPPSPYLKKIVNGYEKNFGVGSDHALALAAHPSIPELKLKFPPHFLIADYNRWPKPLQPWLKWYDAVCVKTLVLLIDRPSIFMRWIS